MQAFIAGVLAAAVLAVAAYVVLDRGVQQGTDRRFQTEGVRL